MIFEGISLVLPLSCLDLILCRTYPLFNNISGPERIIK